MSVQTVSGKPAGSSRKWVRTRIRVKRYDLGCIIGRGAFSKVYLARTTKFLLGEDASDRLTKKTGTLPIGITRSTRKGLKSVSSSCSTTLLRKQGTKLPLPKLVAIKVMKVKLTPEPLEDEFKTKYFKFREPCASELLERKMSKFTLREHLKHGKRKIAPRKAEDILNEVQCLKKVRECKYCIFLHDVVQLKKEIWLVMDFADIGNISSFFKFIFCKSNSKNFKFRKVKKLPKKEELIKCLIVPIMLALNYLHERGMIHRDVKGLNILLTRACIPKLCDFGLVQPFTQLPVETSEKFAGTPSFVPPEVYVNENLINRRNRQITMTDVSSITLFKKKTSTTTTTGPSESDIRRIDTTFDTWSLAITMLVLLYDTSPWKYTPRVLNKAKKPIKFRRPKFPDTQLTRYLGTQLENEVALYGYLRLHKRLFLLEPDEVEENPILKLPRTIPTKHLPKFTKQRREFVEFIKNCCKLRDDRPTIGELLDDEFFGEYVREWERFDSKKETELHRLASIGRTVSRKKKAQNGHETKFERMMRTVGLLAHEAFDYSGSKV